MNLNLWLNDGDKMFKEIIKMIGKHYVPMIAIGTVATAIVYTKRNKIRYFIDISAKTEYNTQYKARSASSRYNIEKEGMP